MPNNLTRRRLIRLGAGMGALAAAASPSVARTEARPVRRLETDGMPRGEHEGRVTQIRSVAGRPREVESFAVNFRFEPRSPKPGPWRGKRDLEWHFGGATRWFLARNVEGEVRLGDRFIGVCEPKGGANGT